jgi:hypothetical protein
VLSLGEGEEVVCKEGAVLDREKFESLKDEYYSLRGWDVATGLQTRAKLEQLRLGDMVDDLEQSEHTAVNPHGPATCPYWSVSQWQPTPPSY